MRNIILLITFFSIFSCKNSESKVEFTSSRVKEINEIVKVIISEDSLDVSKNTNDKSMLCKELIKLNIYIPEKPKNGQILLPRPPSFNDVSITDLLNYDRKSTFFKNIDSLYLLKQNLNPAKLEIDSNVVRNVNFTAKDKEISKKKNGKLYSYYEMTIPIFSLNNEVAYVEVNHYCGRLCGSGQSLYLKKINGKWTVIEKWGTWIS
tara:strand:- start:47 stop:664 length:618 start_codon:yes stop_codon:yes gene_type:complete